MTAEQLMSTTGTDSFDAACALLNLCPPESYRSLSWEGKIPLDRVLTNAWSPPRYERALAKLRAGQTPPPVRTVRIVTPLGDFYDLSDGKHRCAAARDEGHESIYGIVTGVWTVEPERFTIRGYHQNVSVLAIDEGGVTNGYISVSMARVMKLVGTPSDKAANLIIAEHLAQIHKVL